MDFIVLFPNKILEVFNLSVIVEQSHSLGNQRETLGLHVMWEIS